MKKRNYGDIFSATNALKILSFLIKNPGREFLGSEIRKAVPVSRAGVYIALQELVKQKLVYRVKKGKIFMYSALYDEPIIKQFKTMKNMQFLKPLIERLKNYSKKIVLYGSASRGEDSSESDIDLFILAKNSESARDVVSRLKTKRKIQAVVKSPSELADIKDKDKIYYDEINIGITLWEERG